MKVAWTEWAQQQLLPFPGDAWTVAVDMKKAEAGIAKGGVAAVPASPEVAVEVARGLKLRLNERYGPDGNYPRDRFGRDLVDVWCARAGVAFAMEVVIAICKVEQAPRASTPGAYTPYELRRDGQPWARLREHLFAAPADEREAALAHARAAWNPGVLAAKGDLSHALAYVTCEPAWVDAALDSAIEEGYGRLALLAATRDVERARKALVHLIEEAPRYQLVENGFSHMPNLMRTLPDAELVLRAANNAWNRATRKPWLDVVACLDTPAARTFHAEHGDATKPAQRKKAKSTKPTKPTKSTKPTKPTKR